MELSDPSALQARVRAVSTPSGKPKVEDVARCLMTGHPCGTDTRPRGSPCPCHACSGVRYGAAAERERIHALAINVAHGYQRNPAAACVLRDFAARIREGE